MNPIPTFSRSLAFCALVIATFVLSGCQTANPEMDDLKMYETINQSQKAQESGTAPNVTASKGITLHEGDVVRVTFPGSPNLNSVQPIRRDGKITLELAGEVSAAGLTPTELQNEILRLCGPQLVSKEVVVSVESSAFPVFVTGAVVRPGKIMSDRPMTALQAVMESGGFDYSKANLSSVRVIRQEGGQLKNYKVNLKLALQGKETTPFDLKPDDIVYVPEKFTWF